MIRTKHEVARGRFVASRTALSPEEFWPFMRKATSKSYGQVVCDMPVVKAQ